VKTSGWVRAHFAGRCVYFHGVWNTRKRQRLLSKQRRWLSLVVKEVRESLQWPRGYMAASAEEADVRVFVGGDKPPLPANCVEVFL
jgi:hypothetical protein